MLPKEDSYVKGCLLRKLVGKFSIIQISHALTLTLDGAVFKAIRPVGARNFHILLARWATANSNNFYYYDYVPFDKWSDFFFVFKWWKDVLWETVAIPIWLGIWCINFHETWFFSRNRTSDWTHAMANSIICGTYFVTPEDWRIHAVEYGLQKTHVKISSISQEAPRCTLSYEYCHNESMRSTCRCHSQNYRSKPPLFFEPLHSCQSARPLHVLQAGGCAPHVT